MVGEADGAALTVRLRPATPADLPILRAWDEQPHVVAAAGEDGAFDWETELPRAVDWRELLIAELEGRPVGFVQIIDPAREETHYWGDCEPDLCAIDIWLGAETDLGKGLGSEIMRLVIAHCFADPRVTGIVIDPLVSNLRAHRFYERLGFRIVDRRIFAEVDDCYVMRLDRSDWAGT